jgi:hypothetical protein
MSTLPPLRIPPSYDFKSCRYRNHHHDEIVSGKKRQRQDSSYRYASFISVVISQALLAYTVIILSLLVTVVTCDDQLRQTTTLQDYLNLLQIGARNHIAFFKWNTDGWLTNIILPKTKGTHWIDSYYTSPTGSTNFDRSYGINKTSESPHGKVAMVYVWDILIFVLQKPKRGSLTGPPIPMFLFTIPQQQQITIDDAEKNISSCEKTPSAWSISPHLPKTLNSNNNTDNYSLITNNIIQIPNPYEISGFNEGCVNRIINKHENKYLLNISFDMFHQRSNVIIWRGDNHSEIIRNQLVSMSREQLEQQGNTSDNNNTRIWLDAKFSKWSKMNNTDLDSISREDMTKKYKYHLDAGGCSGTSWGGLRWKLCTGNLVFKIETTMIEWWYNTLVPYKHYIPVKEDLSNLYEQYIYIENNPQVAHTIAQNGQTICLNTYKADSARQYIQPIIQSIPNATVEQIQEFDMLLLQQQQQNENEMDSHNT